MSRPRTHEHRLLEPAARLLQDARSHVGHGASVVDFLEGVAAANGGWSLDEFRALFPRDRVVPAFDARLWGEKILGALSETGLPYALAVASLGQPDLDSSDKRTTGAYYTDFRLARYVADQFTTRFVHDDKVVDLACGSGIMLAALTDAAAPRTPGGADDFIAYSVCAADSNPHALDATRASLAMLVSSLEPLRMLDFRLLAGDSLQRPAHEWESVAPGGFAAVIGNPPWEKLKVTRHEVLTAQGVDRHYGALYEDPDPARYSQARWEMVTYLRSLVADTQLQGKGEADLYKLFLELGARVLRPGGELGLLVPAGLIRSQGTEALRGFLIDQASRLSMTVFENRSSFFAIDTRFKFLSVHASFGQERREPVTLLHADGTPDAVSVTGSVRLSRTALRRLRPDLTVPEVRSEQEWDIFQRLLEGGCTLASPEWEHTFQRELDMTNDRALFRPSGGPGMVPLAEGRMVHQHRSMAKAYRSGTGRAAVWEVLASGHGLQQPQFWVNASDLSASLQSRVATVRAGFCDVTGQTNERTLLAAAIPAGIACGNKVPTLTFRGETLSAEEAVLAWVAMANSIVVDWAARRLVTTSMNYFLLRSLPLPRLGERDFANVVRLAADLRDAETTPAPAWEVAEARAEIDVCIAAAFGLTLADLLTMFTDFRLLDRGQPALQGEETSTITRDLVLTRLADRLGEDGSEWADRLDRARRLGAIPYVPADYSAKMRHGRNHDDGSA